ncbi:D-inositol 3-phosphate glycosyltransferase [Rubripirellula obstinata]|uniref:D-inositol 3-phosphate glycosyltransferase n=1 Tax=Rubripirellula obstinata TaxID=406547 RepID=A0A5B1CHG5_9BACT|nr:glycosyltransferase family 4 protein [Rubripirellula obstinata]KAA1259010.1 D-inositol 3-phosphate glycosyltransferase [Rubripirellula obstinata]
MTEMLAPNVQFAAMSGRQGYSWDAVDSCALTHANFRGIRGRLNRQIYMKSVNGQLVKIVNEMGPQSVILIHYLTAAVQLSEMLSLVPNPVFVHCHGHDVTWNRRSEFLPFLPAHGYGYVSKVKAIMPRITPIANSNATRAKLADIGFDPDRTPVKYLGVEVPDDMPADHLEPTSEKTILYLGRLTDFKGPVETIKAFTLACERGLNARLVMAGGGHQQSACESARKDSSVSEKIDLLGPVNSREVKDLMRDAVLFTAHNKTSPLTGQEEAFGVTVIEAMALGLPVVTGRSGGVCETIVHEETGILFSPGDIEAHADALLRLCNCPEERARMGRAAHKRAKSLFSTEKEKQRLDEILFSLSAVN